MLHLVLGTAGHIDHGKSALVQALTGTDPDRLKEEKARGITIDLGFAHATDGDLTIAFVDVPGHERFVRNMLAGVGGIDCVLLVVAADESVMPQTREHFDICRLLGITRGVVALTKADLVDEDTVQLVRLEVAELLKGTPLARAPMVAVSAKTGQGLDELRAAIRSAARDVPARETSGVARLPIDRAFSVKGFGTVVTGTLVSGQIAVDDELAVMPDGPAVKVRGLHVHGERQARAAAGQRVAVNLGGVEVAALARGQVLATPGAFVPTRVLDVEIDLLPGAKPLEHGRRVRFHQGTIEVLGRVALMAKGEGAGLAPGTRGFARMRLERPAVLTRGDRFILRAYSPPLTIGGGIVLDPQAPRAGIRQPGTAERFTGLGIRDQRPETGDQGAAGGGAGSAKALAVMIEERGPQGLPIEALTTRAGVAPGRRGDAIAELARAGAAEEIGGFLLHPRVRTELAAALERIVREYHAQNPLSEGLPREEARERLFAHAAAPLFDRVLADLAATGSVTGRDRLAGKGHRLSLDPAEARARDAIERTLREAALKPPDTASLAAAIGARPEVVERMLGLLARQKQVVRLDALYFHQAALERLKQDVRGLRGGSTGDVQVDVASFKDRYGISRKFAIPLLEYLDRERVTRRVGDARLVL